MMIDDCGITKETDKKIDKAKTEYEEMAIEMRRMRDELFYAKRETGMLNRENAGLKEKNENLRKSFEFERAEKDRFKERLRNVEREGGTN